MNTFTSLGASEPQPALAAPKALGRYQCNEKLSEHAMLESWRAQVRGLAGVGREYVIKCLRSQGEPSTRERFAQAGRRAATLKDKRIALLTEVGAAGDMPFTVTEWVHGLDLATFRHHAQQSGQGPGGRDPSRRWFPVLAHIGREVARALAVAHAAEVVHGGLSPGNVIVTPQGAIKLTDFAIRAAVQLAMAPATRDWRYHEPKERADISPTTAGDVFALGALMLELAVEAPILNEDDRHGALARVTGPLAEALRAMLSADSMTRPSAVEAAQRFHAAMGDGQEEALAARLGTLVRRLSPASERASSNEIDIVPMGAIIPSLAAATARSVPAPSFAAPALANGAGPAPLAKTWPEPQWPTLAPEAAAPAEAAPAPARALAVEEPPDSDDASAPEGLLTAGEALDPSQTSHDLTSQTQEMPAFPVAWVEAFPAATPAQPDGPPVALEAAATNVAASEAAGDPPMSTLTSAELEFMPDPPVRTAVASSGNRITAEMPAITPDDLSALFPRQPVTAEVDTRGSEGADYQPSGISEASAGLAAEITTPAHHELTADPSDDSSLDSSWTSEKPHSGRVWMIAGVAAGAVLAAGIGGFMLGTRAGGAPAPTAAAAPALKVMPKPPARPTVVQMPAPRPTPTTLTTAAPPPSAVPVRTGTSAVAAAPAADRAARSGRVTITVKTKPPGASVWAGGRERGRTPASFQVDSGTVRLTLIRAGFQTTKVELDTARSSQVDNELVPTTSPLWGPANVKVKCRKSDRYPVLINGVETGLLCPAEQLGLPPGTYKVGIYLPDQDRTEVKEAVLSAGSKTVRFSR